MASVADVSAEIAAVRVSIRRALELMDDPELPADDLAKLGALVVAGTRAVAYLVRTRHVMGLIESAGLDTIIAKALDQLSDTVDLEL